jgi:hypothetical protein
VEEVDDDDEDETGLWSSDIETPHKHNKSAKK